MAIVSGAIMALASEFAPSIVRRFAGDRAGSLAEALLGHGRRITGRETPEEIAAAMRDNAEFAHEFQMQAAALDVECERAYLADRQDARDMRLELARLGHTDWMMYAVGLIVVVGLVAVVLAIFITPDLSDAQLNLLNVLGGGLLAGFMSVVSYFFGSSRGSKEKNALLGAQQPPSS